MAAQDTTEPDLVLEVWRLHPHGMRIVPADARLLGEAPPGALKWCGPFLYANKTGWWVYPPLDIDIIYKPVDENGTYDSKYDDEPNLKALNRMTGYFEYHHFSNYEHEEQEVIGEMIQPHHQYRNNQRELCSFGYVEMNVVSIWTGCVFKTPPGWCLQIRSPINISLDQPFRIQEGMLETDWMQYDIWMNLKFFRYNEWATLRRDQQYPLAQLVPLRRESYDAKWGVEDNMINCDGPAQDRAVKVFESWNEYNYKKWMSNQGSKDPATHNKERKRPRHQD
jgi:hypothetical protein